MEKFQGKFQDRSTPEVKRGLFQDHCFLDGTGQVDELRDRFGITCPKLLARALRISESRAIELVKYRSSTILQEEQ